MNKILKEQYAKRRILKTKRDEKEFEIKLAEKYGNKNASIINKECEGLTVDAG